MIGKTIAHYEILDKLGEGGMGVVYKARDTHLDRKARFVQEAKSASALNHPNIVHIYDIDQQDGVDFMAMEYVAGKTLDELIPRKGMRLNEALKIAVQVAGALSTAHEAGIIHRDLKPGNIMVGDDGRVRVLDFGLAKLMELVPESEETRTVAAEKKPQTEEGTILGTASYMSPEQAEGKKVDTRSDIFSFGSVLYEMVTGRRPFVGDSNMSTLAAIIKEEPKPVRALAEEAPGEVERIVKRCLRKDPERRFQLIKDLKVELEDLKEESDSGMLAAAPRAGGKASWRRIAVAAAAILAIAVAGWQAWERTDQEPRQANLAPTPLTSYPGVEAFPTFSPDGDRVAFAWNQKGQSNIFIKLIGSGGQQQLTDTGLDSQPAWSPDGREIAFLRGRAGGPYELMLIPSVGGRERRVGEVSGVWHFGGRLYAWHPSGDWLVIRDQRGPGVRPGVSLLSPQTGEKRKLTSAPAGEGQDVAPAISPDGRALVFSRVSMSSSELWLRSLTEDPRAEGEPQQLTSHGRWNRDAVWLSNGQQIAYVSADGGMFGGTLWRLKLPGTEPPEHQAFAGQQVSSIAVAPVGDRLAFSQLQVNFNLWQVALTSPGTVSGAAERLTNSTRSDIFVSYSPDGGRIAFMSLRSGRPEVWSANADGSDAVQLTSFGGADVSGSSWSPDGRRIAVKAASEDGRTDLYLVGSDGGSPKRLTFEPGEDGGVSSWTADGKWIYFNSNRTGREECWKIPAEGGQAIQVTETGGAGCREGPSGQYLYFNRLYAPSEGGPYRGWHVMRMPLAGGEPERILGPILLHSFSVADEGIYFQPQLPAGEDYSVRFHEFASRSSRSILKLKTQYAYGVVLSPDGRHLVWSQLDDFDADLMLVEGFR